MFDIIFKHFQIEVGKILLLNSYIISLSEGWHIVYPENQIPGLQKNKNVPNNKLMLC